MKDYFFRILMVSIIVFTAGFAKAFAQTVNEVVETYNMGAEAMNAGEIESAIMYFEETVMMSEQVGPDVEEYKVKAESVLPGLYYKDAMETFKADNFEEAVEKMRETVEVAESYNDTGIKEKAERYIPQFLYAHGNELYKAKEWEKAVDKYEASIELDPEYVNAYFRIALVHRNQNNEDQMVEYFKQVIENGASGNSTVEKAISVLRSHYLKKAQSAINSKDYTTAVENLEASLEFGANEGIYYYLAIAYNGLENWDKAIENALKSVEISTGSDSDKAGAYYELGKAYAAKGDNSSACEAYANAAHGKFEEAANYQREHILSCQ
jgi:tetratricopeptide (TPR) repeat protein